MDLLSSDWVLEFHSGIPVYKQIVHHVQAAIASGALQEGDQLPTVRALHQKLDVNPNTVAKAYRELELSGYLVTHRGSGCFVAPQSKKVRPPTLSVRDRNVKVKELRARFEAEARSFGLSLDDLLNAE
jgi:GntR family transcriptional regulator